MPVPPASRLNSLTLRLVGGAGLWIAVALFAGGFALSSLFRDYVERSFDARLNVRLESLVGASEIDEGGRVRLSRPVWEDRFEQVYSGWYWQISADGTAPLRSRSLWDQVLPETPPSPGDPIRGVVAPGPDDAMLRIVSRDIRLPGSQHVYRYSVGADRRDIEAEIAIFNATLTWSLSVLGVGLLAALLIQVWFGLRPLHAMRAALVDVRAGRTDRLEGNFPAEIRPLSDELNVLIDHNAAVVERARTHVSNLAHALKTPLSVLTNEAATASGPLAETVRRQCFAMRRHVDHYLARARTAATGSVAGARSQVAAVVEDLRRTLARIHRERPIAIEVAIEPDLWFRGERADLEEMLGNLIDNACKWALGRVRIAAGRDGDRLRLSIEDDGPGLDETQRAELFRRGRRLDESVPGTGLGLAIVRDVAELYDGAVTLDRSELGGLRAVLLLPSAGGSRPA